MYAYHSSLKGYKKYFEMDPNMLKTQLWDKFYAEKCLSLDCYLR